MRRFLLGVAFVAVAASVAHADDRMTSRFGNTTITKDANGTENKLYYNADGTFKATQGSVSTQGTWKIEGDTICLTANPPIPNTPNPTCAPLTAHNVGDTWQAGPFTVSLVAGIQ